MLENLLKKIKFGIAGISLISNISCGRDVNFNYYYGDGEPMAIIDPCHPYDNEDLLCYMVGAENQEVLEFTWATEETIFTDDNIYTDEYGSNFPSDLTGPGDSITCRVEHPFLTLYASVRIEHPEGE